VGSDLYRELVRASDEWMDGLRNDAAQARRLFGKLSVRM
jgi:hypothetical protein